MDPLRSDRLLAVLALTLLASGCVFVLWPFLTSLTWAAILASISWPAFSWLERRLHERRVVAASLMTLLVTVVLLGPLVAVALALADNVADLGRAGTTLMKDGLPDAPDWLLNVPVIGASLHSYWEQFSHDGERLMAELSRLAQPAQVAALSTGRVVGKGVVDVAMSVFLAFFFFLYGEALTRRLHVALTHLAGTRGAHLLRIARNTVSGVIYGVLGTALAQGVLAATGFAIAGVPGAVLLGFATFFLSLIPIGPPLVWGGAGIWLFTQGEPGWGVFVLLWGFLLVSTVDNVIKPYIISRGSHLPFAVVFLGVLGGVLAFGVIGAFLGPTLLAVGYRLLQEWTSQPPRLPPPDHPPGA